MASAGKGAPLKTTWLDSLEKQQSIRKSFFVGDQDQVLAPAMEDFYFGEEAAAEAPPPSNRAVGLAVIAESWRAPEWPEHPRPVVTPEFEPCSGADVVQGPFYSGAGTSFQTLPDTRFLFPLSVTIAASTKRLLLVYVAHNGVGSISSIKLSGAALTQQGVALNDTIDGVINTAAVQVEIWSIASPGIGTHDLVIDTSPGAMDLSIQAVQYRNVDQTTPLGTVFAAVAGPLAGVSSISVDVLDTIPQSLVVDLVGYNSIPALGWTPGAGQTSRGNVSFGIANSNQNISDEPAGMGGTVTMSGNTTGSVDAAMAQLAVEVRSCVPPPSFVPFRRSLAPVLNSWLLEPAIQVRRLLPPIEAFVPVLLPRARRLAMVLESWRPPDPLLGRRLAIGPQPVCLRADLDINTNWAGPYRTLAGIPIAISHNAAVSSNDGVDTYIAKSSGNGTNPQIFRVSGVINEGANYTVKAVVFTLSTPLEFGEIDIELVTSAGNRYSAPTYNLTGLTSTPTQIEFNVSTISAPIGVGTPNTIEIGASALVVGKYVALTFVEVCPHVQPPFKRWLQTVDQSWHLADPVRQRRLGVVEQPAERVPFSRGWLPTAIDSWRVTPDAQQRRPEIIEEPAPSEQNPFSRYWLNAVADAWLPPDPVTQKRNKQQFESFTPPPQPPPEEVCYPRVDDPVAGFSRLAPPASVYTREEGVSAYTRDAPPGFTGTRMDGPADTFARVDDPDCGETMGYGEGYGIDYGGT